MIKAEHIVKYYGKLLAVDDVSFSVDKNNIVGFLGINGAGKSTTMKMLTGYLIPNSGSINIGGYDIVEQPLEGRKLIGYLPEIVPLYTDMTVREYLGFTARLRGLDSDRVKKRIDEVVEQCSLQTYIDTATKKLSKGYKQRVGIAQAIIHDPPVLILDEPTVGIDPIQLAQIRSLIKELGKERTILLSTHVLSEVSMICEKVIIIKKGRIVAQDSIDNLSAHMSPSCSLTLKVKGPGEKIGQVLSDLATVKSVSESDDVFTVEYEVGREPQNDIMAALVEHGWQLSFMEATEKSLEDIFLDFNRSSQQGDAN